MLIFKKPDGEYKITAESIYQDKILGDLVIFAERKNIRIEITAGIYDYSILDNPQEKEILTQDMLEFLEYAKTLLKADS